MRKKGVSPLITTVLLIIISITAVVVISTIVIPFVRDSLTNSKECFEVLDQITIDTETMCGSSMCTCYYNQSADDLVVNVSIKRGPKEADLDRFKISVSGQGTSSIFDIKTGEPGVRMLDGSTTIQIPEAGGMRTYSLNKTLRGVSHVEVYPVLKSGNVCDLADKAEIESC